MSDRIVILNEGKIVQVGTPKEVYYHPTSEFVANFIGTANILDGTVRKSNVDGTMDIEVLGKVLEGIVGTPHGKSGVSNDTTDMHLHIREEYQFSLFEFEII